MLIPLNPTQGSRWTASRPGAQEQFARRVAARGRRPMMSSSYQGWQAPGRPVVHNAWMMWKWPARLLRRAWRSLAWRVAHRMWREFQRSGVVTPDTPAGRAFRRFGAGSVMAFPAGSVFGEGWIAVGEDTLIAAFVTLSAGTVPGQDLGPDPVLRIGDRCVIGRGSHIVAHQRVEIGDDVWTGPYVYITDQNHGYADPAVPIGRQQPVNRPVSIGAGSWLGAGVIVLPGARIGRNVVVAAGSVVRGEVPDRCVVAGVPATVAREHTEAGWLRPGAVAGPPGVPGPPASVLPDSLADGAVPA